MKDKQQLDHVLLNEATEQEAIEVALFFGSAEGQLQVAQMIDADMETMVPHFNAPARSERMRVINKVSGWWRIAAVVTLVVALGTIAAMVLPTFQAVPLETICANRGEQIQVVLHDGTHVYLNAGSRLVMPSRFTAKQRTVTLVGEAYFEVEQDKHRPFVVDLNGASVEVLGTKFNITAYEDEALQVNLDEGHVLFHGAKQTVDMQAGERLSYDRKTCYSTLYRNADTQMASAWKEHRLEVSEMPMQELVTMLERRYDVHIHIHNEQCYDYVYSMTMSDLSLRTVLKGMAAVSPIWYRYNEEQGKVEIFTRK